MPGEIVSPMAIRRVATLSQFNFLTQILNYVAIHGHFAHFVSAAALSSSSPFSSQFPPFSVFPHLFSLLLNFFSLLYHLLYSALSLSGLKCIFLVVTIFGNISKVPIIRLNKYFANLCICNG